MNTRYINAEKLTERSMILLFILLFFNACNDQQSKTNLRNEFHNDLESYDGWQGISGYYYLNSSDAHSGQHSNQTDSSNIYSITFSKPVKELSASPVKKINISLWVKCLGTPASGAYILSLENGPETYKYFSFELKESNAIVNEWMQLKGTAEIPSGLPKDANAKIYFWNKGKTVILVDDFDFIVEN